MKIFVFFASVISVSLTMPSHGGGGYGQGGFGKEKFQNGLKKTSYS